MMHKWLPSLDQSLSMLYVGCMAILGSVIVAIAQGIAALAANCHTEATNLGTVFIAYAAGSVIGSLLGSPCYRRLPRDFTLGVSSIITGVICFFLPIVTSVTILHLLYFILGVWTGLVDTGASILVNSILGKAAGPWLIAIQLAFNFGGAFAMFFEQMFSLKITSLFDGIGSLNILIGVGIIAIPLIRSCFPEKSLKLEDDFRIRSAVKDPEESGRKVHSKANNKKKILPVELEESKVLQDPCCSLEQRRNDSPANDGELNNDKDQYFPPSQQHYLREGSGKMDSQVSPLRNLVITESDLESAADSKNTTINRTIEPPNYYSDVCIGLLILCIIGSVSTKIVSSTVANFQICIVWFAMSTGVLFSFLLRNYYFPKNQDLPWMFTLFAILAAVGSVLMIAIEKKDAEVLWAGLMLFGFFSRPCVGFAFQWLTVVTYANETSFSIAYVGLNAGAGLIPYITTTLWSNVVGANALFLVLLVCMSLSVPLFYLSAVLSCKSS